MKKVNIFYILGVTLIIVSVALLIISKKQVAEFQTKTKQNVTQLQNNIPSRKSSISEQYTDEEMPVCEIDGVDYCALLEIPRLSTVLPVANNWKNADAYTSRFGGSAYNQSMIIGGQGLGIVTQLDIGDHITVVDMLGGEFSYKVKSIERAREVTEETFTLEESSLILFTYMKNEKKYIVVRCDL